MLTGDAAPHGRLPMTFPLSTGHIPTSTHQRPTGRLIRADVDHREGRYVDALTYPRLPFGFGLTYSSVDYAAPRVADAEIGARVGDDAHRGGHQHRRPRRAARSSRPTSATPSPRSPDRWSSSSTGRLVDLEPGETREVTFEVSATAFAYFGADLTERVDEGEIVLLTGPDAARLQHVSLRITGAEVRP